MKLTLGWLVGTVVWTTIVGTGFVELYRFETTAGPRGDAPSHWPPDCPFPCDADRFTLVMALHPQCPCSRASVRELTEILARFPERLAVQLLVYEPEDVPAYWHDNDLERSLRPLPGVKIVHDRDARLARGFGCATSGHALLYSSQGSLVFGGGITRGRGQDGASLGREVIVERLLGRQPAILTTEVYGCPLFDSAAP